MTVS
jgi:hypothetical protein